MKNLKIYDTLLNEIVDFNIQDNKVYMYVCGPTVYNNLHIGNARPIIFFDMLKTYLEKIGYDVIYASNITDIDDKIINRAIKEQKKESDISNEYTKHYLDITYKLCNRLPDLSPKATTHIEDMIDFIKDLISKGFAYEKNGNVYYRVSKDISYGRLSNQNTDKLISGSRININLDKENSLDFTIWKKTDIGIKYSSPWSFGRPGWHTECAAINNKIFQNLTIHGGGFDLKFPHHENERSQYLAKNNKELAKYWMHVARLDINNEKMSKSLNNSILINDILKKYSPYSFRLLILSNHYRQPINYSYDLMQQVNDLYLKIVKTHRQTELKIKLHNIESNILDDDIIKSFYNEMNNDLNTPNVVTIIQKILKDIIKENDILMKIKYLNTLDYILDILGIKIDMITIDDIKLYNKWIKLRENKDYNSADIIRNDLIERNLV